MFIDRDVKLYALYTAPVFVVFRKNANWLRASYNFNFFSVLITKRSFIKFSKFILLIFREEI